MYNLYKCFFFFFFFLFFIAQPKFCSCYTAETTLTLYARVILILKKQPSNNQMLHFVNYLLV